MSEPEALWTAEDVARHLGGDFDARKVLALARERKIPHRRVTPRKVRFRASEIEAWVEQKKA